MSPLSERCADFLIRVAKYGDSWWMPLLLLAVVLANTLTGGVFIAVLGVLQATILTIIVTSRKYTFFIGPMIICFGQMVVAIGYIRVIAVSGADALLDSAGAASSSWLANAKAWASQYGFWGLAALSATPAPTAVIVVAGKLAQLDDRSILLACFGVRSVLGMLGALGMRVVTEGKTAEEYVRSQLKPLDAEAAEADSKKEHRS